MPHYRKYGKQVRPMTDEDFFNGMRTGKFVHRKHKGYVVVLYYSAVRKVEALRATREQFTIAGNQIFFEVRKRLKHGIVTPPLNFRLAAPFIKELVWAVENTDPEQRVWPYCEKTGYNIVDRVFKYPHFFRASRITQFFLDGWTIAQVRAWTGLTLKALNYYVSMVDVIKMGESLGRQGDVTDRNVK